MLACGYMGAKIDSIIHKANSNIASEGKEVNAAHYRMIAQSEYVSTLQPYITVYMWKRTA